MRIQTIDGDRIQTPESPHPAPQTPFSIVEAEQYACLRPAAAGTSLKLTVAIAASVPNDPIISLAISSPATFLTTMPPGLHQFAVERGKRHADHQVARRAVKPAPRPADVRRDHAADRAFVRIRAFERDHLAVARQFAA